MRKLLLAMAIAAGMALPARAQFFNFPGLDLEARGKADWASNRVEAVNATATQALAEAQSKPSTNLAYIWQGAALVTSRFDIVLGGCATQNVDGSIQLLPYTTNWFAETGTVEIIARDGYLVDANYSYGEPQIFETSAANPDDEVEDGEIVLTETSVVVYAYCMGGGYAYYYATLSNLVAWTYDRPGMTPRSTTNDAPGMVAHVDTVSDFGTDPRRAMNVEAVSNYTDSRALAISDDAWNRTPGGRDTPDRRLVTIDEPLIQQGAISFLQSGDYYCFSYIGGDWMTATTGSTWRIGPSGRTAFEISATNRMLYVSAFSVQTNGYCTLDIATNWVVGTPYIEFTQDLLNPQWLACPEQTMTDNTNYWRGVCPTGTNNSRFFRAISPGGENVIRSHFQHEFLQGIKLSDGATFSTIAELKTLLGI